MNQSLFCDFCRSFLDQSRVEVTQTPRRIQHQKGLELFPIYSLFDWYPDKTPIVSRLILALKYAQAPRETYAFYSEQMFQQRIGSGDLFPENPRLVPCPPTSGKRDHASELTECLEQFTQIKTIQPLEIEIAGAQKAAKAQDRQERRMRVCKNFSLDDEQIHWIFVDDVVTTASTANAAWRALGRPQFFEVWCLARRWLAAPEGL